MITSVEIEGLRGIKEGKLEGLTPLVVLVGPNGSGKSTILEAIYIGVSFDFYASVAFIANRRTGINQGKDWLLWHSDKNAEAEIKVGADNNVLHDRMVKISDYDKTGETLSYLDAIEVKLVDTSKQFFQTPLHTLYSEMVKQGKRVEASNILRTMIPNIDHLEILTEGSNPILHIVYSDHSVPVALAGDGIQALLRLSLELAVRPGGTVLLEEPEVHQHPAAIRQSARAIQAAVRRGVQVILTTHSLELIDALLAEAETDADIEKMSVYRLRLDNGLLKSSCVGGEDIAFSRVEIGDDLR